MIGKLKLCANCCESCKWFKEYDYAELIDYFQRKMSDGYCNDPNPIDDNMPRCKKDYCDHWKDYTQL